MRIILGSFRVDPKIIRAFQGRRETEQRYCTEPRRLDKRPDEETVEIVVFSSTEPFRVAQLDVDWLSGGVASDLDDVVLFEVAQGVVQIVGETLRWEDEFAAE